MWLMNLTAGLQLKSNIADMRCRFFEHMTRSGYTLVESVWQPGSFLTSNHKGKLIVKETRHLHHRHHKCMQFAKFSTSPITGLGDCGGPPTPMSEDRDSPSAMPRREEKEMETSDQSLMHDIAKTVLLNRVEV